MANTKKPPLFRQHLAVDFGTDSIKLFRPGKGLLPELPSTVLVQKDTGEFLLPAPKTSPHLPLHPLGKTGILHYDAALFLLEKAIKAGYSSSFRRPHVLMAVPSNLGDGQKKLLENLALEAGAKSLFTLSAPLAAYHSQRERETLSGLILLIDMGETISNLALIEEGTILLEHSIFLGGRDFTLAVMHHVRQAHHCLLGEASARLVKESIATLSPHSGRESASICAMDLETGLPKTITLDAQELLPSLSEVCKQFAYYLEDFLSEVSPLQRENLTQNGGIAVGGASLLPRLWDVLSTQVSLPLHLGENPKFAVINGLGKLLETPKFMLNIGKTSDFYRGKSAVF